jgi:hypothetical protein
VINRRFRRRTMRWVAMTMLMGCTGGGLLPCASGAERAADGVSCVGGGDTYVPIATGDTGSAVSTETAGPTGDTSAPVDTGTSLDTAGVSDTSISTVTDTGAAVDTGAADTASSPDTSTPTDTSG